ncbi:hypothetical protein EVAR_17689_1 [Eumeta japonica]|uniref:Uncharacterized protein n=1 Tax=Eumeta variegata TaxID=151549 RepID=A0A4C1URR0_EUMVA|nr:hypothetical protein EVAR_17689_1 [Eumeta japonica]
MPPTATALWIPRERTPRTKSTERSGADGARGGSPGGAGDAPYRRPLKVVLMGDPDFYKPFDLDLNEVGCRYGEVSVGYARARLRGTSSRTTGREEGEVLSSRHHKSTKYAPAHTDPTAGRVHNAALAQEAEDHTAQHILRGCIV